MPEEPERDIEKTLKAYAQRRRDEAGAPLELPPAARAQLQREAARLGGAQGGRTNLWAGLVDALRKLKLAATAARTAAPAYVAILFLLVAICAGLFLPSLVHKKMDLAKNDELRIGREPVPKPALDTKEELGQKVAPPAPVPAPTLPSVSPAEQPGRVRGEAAAMNSPPVVTQADAAVDRDKEKFSAPTPPEGNTAAAKKDSADKQLAAAPVMKARVAAAPPATPPPAAAAKPSGGLAANSIMRSTAAVYGASAQLAESLKAAPVQGSSTQRFFRLNAAASARLGLARRTGLNGVLNSFRVELNGGQVRIVDADGSVYSGYSQTTNAVAGLQDKLTPEQASPSRALAQRATTLTNTSGADNRFQDMSVADGLPLPGQAFRVTGTNRSLNQLVVFSGTIMPEDNPGLPPTARGGGRGGRGGGGAGGGAGGGGGGGGGGAGPPATFAAPLPARQLRIVGRALIGATNAMDVNATPTGR